MNSNEIDELNRRFPWLKGLDPLADGMVEQLYAKEAQYAGSWRKRGGVGAYMMTCRKTDRIEQIAERNGYDIFAALASNDADVRDDIVDLITYYMLILCEADRRRQDNAPNA